MRLSLVGLFSLGALTVASTASAHIFMTSPASRYGDMQHQKYWPCGDQNNGPSEVPVVTYTGGETVTITYNEYVGHMGHLRVSIAGSDQDFTLLTAFDDFDNDPTVYLDNIPDPAGMGVQSFQFTIPDIDCNPCVLQLMQVMYDDGMYTPVTPPAQQNDLYFQCADIIIEPTAVGSTGGAESTGPDPTTPTSATTMPADDSTSGDSDPSTSGGGTATTVGETAVTDATMTPTTVTDTDTAGGGDDGGDDGCACHTASDPRAGLLGLMLLLGLARRRR